MNKINLIFSWKFKLKFGNKIWSQGEIGDFWNLEFFKAKEISGKNPKWQEDSKHAQKKEHKRKQNFCPNKKNRKKCAFAPPPLPWTLFDQLKSIPGGGYILEFYKKTRTLWCKILKLKFVVIMVKSTWVQFCLGSLQDDIYLSIFKWKIISM